MEPVPAASRPTVAPASASPGPVFTADPAQGRRYTTARLVRSTDVTPDGRLRFDALARYLQEAAVRGHVGAADQPGHGEQAALGRVGGERRPRAG